MRRKLAALAIAAIGVLAIVPSAQAKWYMNKPAAEDHAFTAVRSLYGDYGVSSPAVSCRRAQSPNQQRYRDMSHRWVCDWADSTSDGLVGGQIAIAGTDGRYGYFYAVTRGIHAL